MEKRQKGPVAEMVFFKPRSVADPEAGESEMCPKKRPALDAPPIAVHRCLFVAFALPMPTPPARPSMFAEDRLWHGSY